MPAPKNPAKKPRVELYARELADLYGLLTLHDYLASREQDVEFVFRADLGFPRYRELLCDRPSIDRYADFNMQGDLLPDPTLIITPYSDLVPSLDTEMRFYFDIAILKNAVMPQAPDAKTLLREQHGIASDRPVLLLARPEQEEALANNVAKALRNDARVILYGDADYTPPRDVRRNCEVIYGHGLLAEMYALADAAIDCHMLAPMNRSLHNFVEATAGGPLFAIAPTHGGGQYGYRDLITAGAIREFQTVPDLIGALRTYVNDSSDALKIAARRTAHLVGTRDRYLPVAHAVMRNLLGRKTKVPASDLEAGVCSMSPTVTVLHSESGWRRFEAFDRQIDLSMIHRRNPFSAYWIPRFGVASSKHPDKHSSTMIMPSAKASWPVIQNA
ncbi:TPA: hypothetical protein HA251_04720 [Candidatus Woesearchaeota archaeon]|nr:hypothetical protein [Candidatus Woesearchaeota archaeon]